MSAVLFHSRIGVLVNNASAYFPACGGVTASRTLDMRLFYDLVTLFVNLIFNFVELDFG